jgi:hypothetical protein
MFLGSRRPREKNGVCKATTIITTALFYERYLILNLTGFCFGCFPSHLYPLGTVYLLWNIWRMFDCMMYDFVLDFWKAKGVALIFHMVWPGPHFPRAASGVGNGK